jgi:hypothetical protein
MGKEDAVTASDYAVPEGPRELVNAALDRAAMIIENYNTAFAIAARVAEIDAMEARKTGHSDRVVAALSSVVGKIRALRL